MPKKIPEFNIERTVRGAIRRVFARSPVKREVLMASRREVPKYNADNTRSKKDAVQYLCSVCETWTKSTAVSVDHIEPVVGVDEGFVDYNTFVARVFCPKENLQVICDGCHDKKTYRERIERLVKQYTNELSKIELVLAEVMKGSSEIAKDLHKETMKKLTTLASKKKIEGLEQIANRAMAMKAALKKIKPTK